MDGAPRLPTRLRPASLRTNALLIALAMLVLPQAIVIGWSLMERDIGGKLQWETRMAVDETIAVLGSDPDAPGVSEAVTAVAARWGTRIRVVKKDGTVVVDADADRGTDVVHQVGTLFFGPDGAPTLRELDETLGPVVKREEVVAVTGWAEAEPPAPPPLPEGTAHRASVLSVPTVEANIRTGCRTSPAGKLLLCHAAEAATIGGEPHVVYAQESSRRAVRALYDLRYHLARLSIMMLPFTLLFAWWMGRRMARPIEWLRDRVLEKARAANPRADIDLRGGEEVRDLAVAFNDLLGALDERRRANEAFAADLVHEFKNPVAAIRSAAESLAASGGADAQRAARIAKILADSSAQLDALVSQFLELARAEAGMPNEDRGDVDLGALAKGITSAREDARYEVEVVEDAIVVGVATRLDSLVRNLVDNAASFAGKDGEVRVRVRVEREDARADGAGPSVILEVSDSGPGIPPADLPRVFDRFFSARKQGRGTGLGLALVKAIAEAHGGSVEARSEGATFRVALPAKPRE
ncbi:MAG: HAMP domain-containing histidine kinase [Labilithrix sp.]|nr:HAMP domain-containing histidine kinase [Labilithrix sp.]MCW5810705.1 HAMP domain-containing histidine kinase [Labilithrix sp.]